MQFTNEFTTPAAPETTYNAMLDMRSVASCLPGATVGEDTDDGGLNATVAVKVGPIKMKYDGVVRIVEKDEAAHTATLNVRAREARGQGTAEANVHLVIEPDQAGSRAAMTTDLSVTGRVASMGAGVMQQVANSMVDQFAACLASKLEPAGPAPAEPEPLKALPLILKGIGAWIRGLFSSR